MLCRGGGGVYFTGLGSFLPFFALSTSVLHTCSFMYTVHASHLYETS